MSSRPADIWKKVSAQLKVWAGIPSLFRYGQEKSLAWMADRLPENGILIADEVGLGKTRLALLAMYATILEGGTVASVVPPGLLYQWGQEAEDVWESMKKAKAVDPSTPMPGCFRIRSYGDIFMNSIGNDAFPLLSPAKSQWVLISQAFDLYVIRRGAASWRVELPALVNACMRSKARTGKKDRWSRYWQQRGYDLTAGELEEQYDECRTYDPCSAAMYLARLGRRSYPSELQGVFDDPDLLPNNGHYASHSDYRSARQECVELFKKNGAGRALLMNMVGKLIGPIDLLVMDEAHKSREDGDVSVTRFGRLVDDVLMSSPRSRRIGMTATPVELNADQWTTLLRRIHGHLDFSGSKQIREAISRFAALHSKVIRNPDQIKDVDDLLVAACRFSRALSPMVTRRRRMHQVEWQRLLPPGLINAGAHPHRTYSLRHIEINGLDDLWRKMVLALESQGIAAKGISQYGLACRQIDIRYAQGLNCEFDIAEDEYRTADRKMQRTVFWKKLQKDLSERINGGVGNWLWNHPRILQSADRIEELCRFKDGRPQDKVLVFGRFTAPLHALRDVLNARHLLRIIDMGTLAFPPALGDDGARLLHMVWAEQARRGTFVGKLAGIRLTQADLASMVRDVRRRYEAERDRLAKIISVERKSVWRDLKGDNAIEELGMLSKAKQRDLFTVLRAEVFDRMLHEGRDMKGISPTECRTWLAQAWKEHCHCMLHGQDDDVPLDGQEDEDARLDARADNLDPEKIIEYFKLGKPGESDARSQFCRVLEGSVQQTTRRAIQSGFNDRVRGPHVLVAQSTVGREGLNLHKACRKVFLLHPEWNPGIMEQQIGRVDRIESLWTYKATAWLDSRNGALSTDDYPKIEIESAVFKGTYDQYQFQILSERRKSLNAQLFGELLDEETLARIPSEYHKKVAEAAPDWSP